MQPKRESNIRLIKDLVVTYIFTKFLLTPISVSARLGNILTSGASVLDTSEAKNKNDLRQNRPIKFLRSSKL